jgi:hypothetical protein
LGAEKQMTTGLSQKAWDGTVRVGEHFGRHERVYRPMRFVFHAVTAGVAVGVMCLVWLALALAKSGSAVWIWGVITIGFVVLLLVPLHRPCQSDVQQDLPGRRISSRL